MKIPMYSQLVRSDRDKLDLSWVSDVGWKKSHGAESLTC